MKYRTVHEALFSDLTYIDGEPDAKFLMMYLLCSPHGNMIGCFRLPVSYIAEDMGYPIDRVSIALTYLIDRGFTCHCEQTGWVWIRNYLRYNPVRGPKLASAANRLLSDIPKQCSFYNDLIEVFSIAYEGVEIPYRYPINTPPIPPARGRAPDQDQDQDQYKKDSSANADSSSASDDPGSTGPPGGGCDSGNQNSLALCAASPAAAAEPTHDPPAVAFKIWLDVVGDALPVPKNLDRDRRRKLELRLRDSFENDLERWRDHCGRIRGSPVLTGLAGRDWRANFDWCLEPKNLRKILEGNYDDPGSGRPGKGPADGKSRRGGALASRDATSQILRERRRRASG